jgi:hypothetical protein
MNGTLKRLFPLLSRRSVNAMERGVAEPEITQDRLRNTLIVQNKDTVFGREHAFSDIRTVADFRNRIPIRDYEGFRPYVDRMTAGETGVLTRTRPFMYASTSGTTGKAKRIPITTQFRKTLACTSRYWLYRAYLDHPDCFDGGFFIPSSPAIEGYVECGRPYGAMSGLTYQTTPWLVRRAYVMAYDVMLIGDYDLRYYVMMRMAIERSVSFACTANPSTWLRLAEEARAHGEIMVRAIADGRLGRPDSIGETSPEDQAILQRLEAALNPNPQRAAELAAHIQTQGVLRPKEAWPKLALLVCWLGGSAGVQAKLLAEAYGGAPIRDIGYRASEATISLPVTDWTPAGLLATHANYYEFIPEQAFGQSNPTVLEAHELEEGCNYYILLTTASGLYRYNIHDVVSVDGFEGRTPLLSFQRKGVDMVSLTGEKLHANQVIHAINSPQCAALLQLSKYCLVPDVNHMRYDLLVELDRTPEASALGAFVTAFDAALGDLNMEYQQKRASHRLHPPRLVVMRHGWSEREKRRAVYAGQRDVQYKWPIVQPEMKESYGKEIVQTVP